jgi:hypothetical protein
MAKLALVTTGHSLRMQLDKHTHLLPALGQWRESSRVVL